MLSGTAFGTYQIC